MLTFVSTLAVYLRATVAQFPFRRYIQQVSFLLETFAPSGLCTTRAQLLDFPRAHLFRQCASIAATTSHTSDRSSIPKSSSTGHLFTLLGLQSRFGHNWGQNTWNLSGLPPKRDCISERVEGRLFLVCVIYSSSGWGGSRKTRVMYQ